MITPRPPFDAHSFAQNDTHKHKKNRLFWKLREHASISWRERQMIIILKWNGIFIQKSQKRILSKFQSKIIFELVYLKGKREDLEQYGQKTVKVKKTQAIKRKRIKWHQQVEKFLKTP